MQEVGLRKILTSHQGYAHPQIRNSAYTGSVHCAHGYSLRLSTRRFVSPLSSSPNHYN